MIPSGYKLFIARNGQFDYGGRSKDAHGRSRFWVDVLQVLNFPGNGKLVRSGFGILSGAQEIPSRNIYMDALGAPHDGDSFVSLRCHSGPVIFN